jgi:hydroxyacylglutathione hydrolase
MQRMPPWSTPARRGRCSTISRARSSSWRRFWRPITIFCGDTLFACGCGRVFEGTPQQMYASLEKLRALPDETKVYCGHEYTLANIGFAKGVEPGNAALAARETRDRRLREAGKPTLPSRLGEEKATNPFLRCTEPAVVESVNKYLGTRVSDPVRVFAAIREWKNNS